LKDSVHFDHPAVVSAIVDPALVVGTGQIDLPAKIDQVAGREASGVLGRLGREQLTAKIIEST
jgi:hypothetical protein